MSKWSMNKGKALRNISQTWLHFFLIDACSVLLHFTSDIYNGSTASN